MGVADNLAAVRADIEQACAAHHRSPGDVTLIAVSKNHAPQAIRDAYAAGQRDFGESYAQELRDKRRDLADLEDIRWHFIGRVQSNKARYIVPCARVHALASRRHADALASRGPVDVLISVNLAAEPQKTGVGEDQLQGLLIALQAVENVHVRGLMTLPPGGEPARPWFERLNALADRFDLPERSMGMSGDFADAIAAGSTHLRIGTAIFGPRPS